MEEIGCPHLLKSICTSSVRKKMRTITKAKDKDKQNFCNPCEFRAFKDSNEEWCCLQCGKISCGDKDAQNGDAYKHFMVPHSDLHAVVVHVGNDSRCWCYECKAEISNECALLKEAILLVKRSIKFSSVENTQANDTTAQATPSIAIPLPPPVPLSPHPVVEATVDNVLNFAKNNKRQQAYTSSSIEPPKISDEPLGLTNLGNTCFMNSALQCLASTRDLIPKLEVFGSGQEIRMLVGNCEGEAKITVVSRDAVQKSLGESESRSGGGDALSLCDKNDFTEPLQIVLEIAPQTMTGRLRHTIRSIRKFETSKYQTDTEESMSTSLGNRKQSSYFSSFTPREVHELVAKNFRRGAQHDAHELLRTIVDMMKKDQTKAFRVAIMKHYGVKKGGEDSDPKHVELVKSLDEKVKHKTFVDEVFGGELMTTQTCLVCKHVKRSHEQFLDLSLPLRVVKHFETDENKPVRRNFFDERNNIVIMKSLEDCLRYFTEPELLTGSNVVECENCHQINLERVKSGISPEIVFPSLAAEKSSQNSSGEKSNRGSSSKKKEDRKKKRASRQAKIRNRMNFDAKNNVVEEDGREKDAQSEPSTTLPITENHFQSEDTGTGMEAEEGTKMKDEGETLEDFVLIRSGVVPSGSKRKIGDVDQCGDTRKGADGLESSVADNEEEIPLLIDESQYLPLLSSSKIISDSLQNLNLKMETDKSEAYGDVAETEGDIDDLPPALEGIGGSASESEGDTRPDVDLDLPSYNKFGNFELTETVEHEAEKEPLLEKPITADEGFSDGENSVSVDNEATRPISQNPSASSSRNSISDSDETSKSSSNENDEEEKPSEISLPKVTKCPCSRQQSISRPPENLTIHFKRFQMSMGGFPTKVSETVRYPMLLDLTPFCSRDGDKAEDSFDADGQVLYALYGIVEHSGSMNWGHYIAYVKSSENEKRWFYISDSSVSVTSLNRVTDAHDAYILFYERIRGAEKKRRLNSASSIPFLSPFIKEPEKADEFTWDADVNSWEGL